MPDFRVVYREKVSYAVDVKAANKEEARAIVVRQMEEGETDCHEVDGSVEPAEMWDVEDLLDV